MNIYAICLFPKLFDEFLQTGVIGQALSGKRQAGEHRLCFKAIDLRQFATNSYKGVDDKPFGGAQGMVLRADILQKAIDHINELESIKQKEQGHDEFIPPRILCPSPRGKVINASSCQDLYKDWFPCPNEGEGTDRSDRSDQTVRSLVFLCGRYEGIDERFLQKHVKPKDYFSIGNYVISGGELAVMVALDCVLRFAPGVLKNQTSAHKDSYQPNQRQDEDQKQQDGLLAPPRYTKPIEFDGVEVPEVLRGGHHAHIEEYNLLEQMRLTRTYRPDLLKAKI